MNYLIGATLLGAISPLLTLIHLWQIKEWRIDRLREHLREEGVFHTLYGKLRPLIVGIYVLLFGALYFLSGHVASEVQLFFLAGYTALLIAATLGFLVVLAALQFLLHRQPLPTWTIKALMVTATSTVINIVVALVLAGASIVFLPLLVLLQPIVLLLAWIFLKPVDYFLKQRIYARARTLRKAHPDVRVIGITGSVGKTTTKELLAHVLKPLGAHATPAYMNAEIGLARWLTSELSLEKPAPILIVEMGAYRTGEIRKLAEISLPEIGVVTFIGTQHIGLFGSQEALIAAKSELLQALPQEGHAFLNADSELCAKMREHCACPVTLVGTGGTATLEAFDIEETARGMQFRLGDALCQVPLHGTHNVTNVLLTIAVAEHLGLRQDAILASLKSFSPLAHTFSVRTESGVTILDDTHNASAASFRAAIEWAKEQVISPKILLTPGLIELGEEHDRTHTDLGSMSAKVFDRVIFTSTHGKQAFERGYGKPTELRTKSMSPVPRESLLCCVGRVSSDLIHSLLPRS